MGKGDTRTRRGKIYNGSHGKKRPGRLKKAVVSKDISIRERGAAPRTSAARKPG